MLAENCKTRYSVWYDIEGCTEPEAFAAEELSRALRELTGANFALITLPQPEPAIIVGSPTYIKDKFGIDLAAEDVGNEGFIIRTVGKDIVIAGGRPRGTLYGVYDFLERFCGCRWYTPTVKKMPFTLKLEVPDEELDALTQEMEKIIAFADTVSHAPVSDTGFDNIHHLENGFRPDVVTPSLPQEEILQNAERQ